MVYTAEEAAKKLEGDGISVEIVDLRTVMPWDKDAVLESARKTSKVLVLHEDTRTGGFGAEIAATIAEEAFEDLDGPVEADRRARLAGAVLARAREGVHPTGRGRREGTQRAGGVLGGLVATGTQVDVVMPQMGVSVSEGTITKWLKSEGETIARRRAAARDLDRQGRHRDPEPRRGRRHADPPPGGRDRRRRHGARGDRAGGSRGCCPRRPEDVPEPATQAAADASEAAANEVAEPTAPTPDSRSRSHADARAGGRACLRQRPDVRLAGRRAHRRRARRRPEHGPGDRHRRPRDEEGHPRLRRERRAGRASAAGSTRAGSSARRRLRRLLPLRKRPLRHRLHPPRLHPPRLRHRHRPRRRRRSRLPLRPPRQTSPQRARRSSR